MELVPLKTVNGEEKAWNMIQGLCTEEVCRNACVVHDPETGSYVTRSFGTDFRISLPDRQISAAADPGSIFLTTFKDFFRLSLLWYLTSAKEIPATGRLIKPLDVKGGQRFFTGTHLLPLDKLALKYGSDRELFLSNGKRFGGEEVQYGDAAIRLYPMPRVPITMILWLEDEEFPARVDLLFDSTIDLQISLSDIVWSVATLTALVMLV